MSKLYIWLTDLMRGEKGQDMIEYALIASVIGIVIVLATATILEPAFTTWANRVQTCIVNSTNFSFAC